MRKKIFGEGIMVKAKTQMRVKITTLNLPLLSNLDIHQKYNESYSGLSP